MQRAVPAGHVVRRTKYGSFTDAQRQLLRDGGLHDGGGRRALRTRLLLPARVGFGDAAAVLRRQEGRFYGIMVHVQRPRFRDVE